MSSDQRFEFLTRNSKGVIWQIQNIPTGMLVFVYQDEEIEAFKHGEQIKQLKQEFYDLVKEIDVHHYFNPDNITVEIDSKQNFDENYKGNWHYYYK